jgi:hypothetical protein
MNMGRLVSFVTVEIDSLRPASQDCRHLDRAMLCQLRQDGLCAPLTLAITRPQSEIDEEVIFTPAAQVHGVVS